jgi:non-ribosomal peptide synthetase component F
MWGLREIQRLAGLGELFDTLVVFENYPVALAPGAQSDAALSGPQAGDVRLSAISGRDATHYPLVLTALPGDRLQLRLSYQAGLFGRSDIEALARRLTRLLEAAVADPGRAIGTLEILGAEERRTILETWNATSRVIAPATLPELFAAQVARTLMRPRWCSRVAR